jgi:hypothetical protein
MPRQRRWGQLRRRASSAAVLALGVASWPGLALAEALGGDLTLALDGEAPPEAPPPPPAYLPGPPLPTAPYPSAWPADRPQATYPPAALPAVVPDAGLRLLFGGGLHVGVTYDQFLNSNGGTAFTLGLGGYLRLGAQLNDSFGISAEGSGDYLLLFYDVRGALAFEWTPSDTLTLALGPVFRQDALGNVCEGPGGYDTIVQSLGAAARVDLHSSPSRSPSGRSAFTIGFGLDVGTPIGSNGGGAPVGQYGLALGFYITIGWAHY